MLSHIFFFFLILYSHGLKTRLTFSVCDAVRGDGAAYVDHAAAVGHFILTGVFTGVVVVDGVNDTQIQDQPVQDLEDGDKS